MFSNFHLRKTWLLRAGGLLLVAGLISFTEVRQAQKRCRAIEVRIDNLDGHSFLNRRDVTGYLTNQGADPIIGNSFDDINFRRLERRLLTYSLIRNCQVLRDLEGNLIVTIEQPRPLARLTTSGDDIHPVLGQYISEEGQFFPLSMNYSARVPLISGAYLKKRRRLTAGSPLLALLKYIQQDAFWRAQLVELAVDQQGDVTMWPQVGSHRIELGQPTDLDAKFKKLKLVYTTILPAKGWDRYSRVNVQYRNQIVCE